MVRPNWLTTCDNPFDPWVDPVAWEQFDCVHGYKTFEKLAAICADTTNLSENDDEETWEKAKDDLISLFPGLYTRVYQT